MPILSSSELAGLRNTLSGLLPDLCDISRDARADDGFGGQSSTPSSVATNVPVLISAIRLRHSAGVGFDLLGSSSAPAQVLESGKYNLTLPQGTDIQLGDTVTVTSLGSIKLKVITVIVNESLEVVQQAAGLLIEEEG